MALNDDRLRKIVGNVRDLGGTGNPGLDELLEQPNTRADQSEIPGTRSLYRHTEEVRAAVRRGRRNY